MALSRQDGKSRPNKYSNSDKFLGRSPTYDNMEANIISKLITESSQESQRFRPCSATCSHVTLNKLFHLSHLRDTTICLHCITEDQMRQHTHKSPVNCQVSVTSMKRIMLKCTSIPSTFSKNIHYS